MPIVLQSSTPTASTSSSQGRDAGEILEMFVRECGDRPPDGVLALRWLNDRYRQIWGTCQWSFAVKEEELILTDDITSDSVTLTASTTVTETTSDSKWTSAVIGRRFRRTGDNQWYTISNYANTNPDTLTLDHTYGGTVGTLVGYRIFQNIYALSDEVGQILSIYSPEDDRELIETNQQWLDLIYPHRSSVGSPVYWAPAGRDGNDIYQVEIYPIPDDDHILRYRYVQEAPYVTGGEAKLVPQVFQSLLKHGWKADYWHWRQTMEDASGQEYVYAIQEEQLFDREVSQMIAREIQNLPPQKLRMAGRYIAHRGKRANKFASTHSKQELP